MDKKFILVGLLIFVLSLGILIVLSQTQKVREADVDCFDRYGSLINELSCEETQYSYFSLPFSRELNYLPIILIFSLMIGLLAIIAGFLISSEDNIYYKDSRKHKTKSEEER